MNNSENEETREKAGGCEEKRKEIYVWQDIVDAENDWLRRIIDAECIYNRSENFRCAIEDSLYRQQLGGFLTVHDIAELRYFSTLWIQLLNTISSYQV